MFELENYITKKKSESKNHKVKKHNIKTSQQSVDINVFCQINQER